MDTRNMTGTWLLLSVPSFCFWQFPSWEANGVSASQAIFHILWNPKIRCRVFDNSSLDVNYRAAWEEIKLTVEHTPTHTHDFMASFYCRTTE